MPGEVHSMRRQIFTEEHDAFRDMVRAFIAKEITPHHEQWERDKIVSRDVWLAAGRAGLLGIHLEEKYGGGGQPDYRFYVILNEELARAGASGPMFQLHNDMIGPYLDRLCTPEQRERWFPGYCSGELIAAIAMTEPGAGSDLQGVRTTAVLEKGGGEAGGDHWVLNGAKTFITNGIQSDLVIVVARTDSEAGAHGISLLVVERGMPGFSRGRKLDKIGLQAQDTAELFFDDVQVPATNLLGREGGGFVHLMERLPRERMSIAAVALAASRAALDWTVEYTTQRKAFGKPIAEFQNTAFELASLVTEVDVLEAYLDKAVLALNAGELTAVDAAKAKLWATEVQHRVLDRCLQLFGGYGFMTEYPIARAYADARVQTIYGGTSEIMKTIIARDLTGLRA